MTEINPPFAVDGTTSPASSARRMMQAIMGPGVARSGHLAVAQNGTPNMTVVVATGGAFVQGTTGTYQGVYYVENQGAVSKAIATAHPSNPRIDLVVARVRETAIDGTGVTAWDVHVVTGTPAGSPVAPSVPASSLVLATVSVPAAATSITDARIANTAGVARPWNSSWGEVARTADRTSPQTGIGTSWVDLTGLGVTFQAVAGRKYVATAVLAPYSSAAGGYLNVGIRNGSNTVLQAANVSCPFANSQQHEIVEAQFTATGATTIKVSLQQGVASPGNANNNAGATSPSYVRITDVGPA